jgi:hypothetical protein
MENHAATSPDDTFPHGSALGLLSGVVRLAGALAPVEWCCSHAIGAKDANEDSK